MTQEEIEELEFLNNKFENYSGPNYTQDWPHESRRMCFLTGKKEEHDKVREVIKLARETEIELGNVYSVECLDEILEKLQS